MVPTPREGSLEDLENKEDSHGDEVRQVGAQQATMRTLMFLRRRKPVPDLEKQRLWCDHDWHLWRSGHSRSLAVDTSKVQAEVLPPRLQRDVLSLWRSVHEDLVTRSSLQEDDVI